MLAEVVNKHVHKPNPDDPEGNVHYSLLSVITHLKAIVVSKILK